MAAKLTKSGLTSGVVREVHVFRPTLLNEIPASVNRSPNHQGGLSDGTDWADKLGLPNPFGANGWPSIYTGDSQFLYYGGLDADNFKDQNMTQFQFEDNVTWIKGKHTVQFGFRGRTEQNNVREMQRPRAATLSTTTWTSLYDPQQSGSFHRKRIRGSGTRATDLPQQPVQSWLLLLPAEGNRIVFPGQLEGQQPFDPELGLRWDKWTPYKEKYNRLVNLDLNGITATNMQVITPGNTTMGEIPGIPPSVLNAWAARGTTWVTADQAGVPGALTPRVNGDLGPRLGVAYRLTDKFRRPWVLRHVLLDHAVVANAPEFAHQSAVESGF